MIDPSLALQTAIRTRLISLPAITDLVPADHIRAGSTRPENFPAIMIADGTVEYLGRDYTAQRLARVFLDIHVWAIEAGLDTARTIGFAVCNALDAAPAIDGCSIDDYSGVTRAVWPRDPDPEYGHGVLSIEALIRWTI
jgi:hypothetical protein